MKGELFWISGVFWNIICGLNVLFSVLGLKLLVLRGLVMNF